MTSSIYAKHLKLHTKDDIYVTMLYLTKVHVSFNIEYHPPNQYVSLKVEVFPHSGYIYIHPFFIPAFLLQPQTSSLALCCYIRHHHGCLVTPVTNRSNSLPTAEIHKIG